MIRIASANELLESFRPMERDQVELPLELRFPLLLNDYLSWVEPSGCRVYLVVADPDRGLPMGVVFRRDQGKATSSCMCQWCHSTRSGDEVTLLTATASSNRRVGLPLCKDLSCRSMIEEKVEMSRSHREEIRALTRRMTEFARRHLF